MLQKRHNFMDGCTEYHYSLNQKGDNLLLDQFQTRIMNQSIKFIFLRLHKDKNIGSNIQTVTNILPAFIYELSPIYCWLLSLLLVYTNCHTYIASFYIQTVTHLLPAIVAIIYELSHIYCRLLSLLYTNCHTYIAGYCRYYKKTVTHILPAIVAIIYKLSHIYCWLLLLLYTTVTHILPAIVAIIYKLSHIYCRLWRHCDSISITMVLVGGQPESKNDQFMLIFLVSNQQKLYLSV